MADPAAILGGLKAAAEAKRGLELLTGNNHAPRFGHGSAEAERKCTALHVFLTVAGAAASTHHRLWLAPTLSAVGARDALANELGTVIDQDDICDENGFRLCQTLQQAPMTEISAGCRLSLQLVYSTNLAERSSSEVIGGLKRGVGSIFNKPSP